MQQGSNQNLHSHTTHCTSLTWECLLSRLAEWRGVKGGGGGKIQQGSNQNLCPHTTHCTSLTWECLLGRLAEWRGVKGGGGGGGGDAARVQPESSLAHDTLHFAHMGMLAKQASRMEGGQGGVARLPLPSSPF